MRVFATGWSEGFDGPGRRWVVYTKGCNLTCRWCANPEGLSAAVQMLFYPGRSARHHSAFECAGEEISVREIVSRAERYRGLFGCSGGVTFGGGEATLQADELVESIKLLRLSNIHVALETNATSSRLSEFAGLADLLICDLKCVCADRHREWTGTDNAGILENLRAVASQLAVMWVRVPVVPGFNDDWPEWERIADVLVDLTSRCSGLKVELLCLHHNGEPKYAALDMSYPMAGTPPPGSGRMKELCDFLIGRGVDARLGDQVW